MNAIQPVEQAVRNVPFAFVVVLCALLFLAASAGVWFGAYHAFMALSASPGAANVLAMLFVTIVWSVLWVWRMQSSESAYQDEVRRQEDLWRAEMAQAGFTEEQISLLHRH